MQNIPLSEKELADLKADLLHFIHMVATGQFNSPEHIQAFLGLILGAVQSAR